MKVLYVIPDLEHGGTTTQLGLLAAGLPRAEFELSVCALGGEGPVGERLRQAGLRVETLRWWRAIDLRPMLRLRRLLGEFQPNLLHAWQLPALRAAFLARGGAATPLVASAATATRAPGELSQRLDRWLLKRADRVIAAGPAEARRCREQGAAETAIQIIPPGVLTEDCSLSETSAICNLPSALEWLPPRARVVLCVGPLEPSKGHRDAVWAFDILKYLYDDVHLLLAGEGSARSSLAHFTRLVRAADRVHFLGRRSDLPALLARCEVVWVPSLREGGRNVVLEAMAAGKPVVASRRPDLAEIVVDGETGLLFPPGDKVALARQTRQLLDDAARRRRMGDAGRQRAEQHFSTWRLVEDMARLYHVLKRGHHADNTEART